jgi:hypothetical protein
LNYLRKKLLKAKTAPRPPPPGQVYLKKGGVTGPKKVMTLKVRLKFMLLEILVFFFISILILIIFCPVNTQYYLEWQKVNSKLRTT